MKRHGLDRFGKGFSIVLVVMILGAIVSATGFMLNLPVVYNDSNGNCIKVIMPDENGNVISGDCDDLPDKYFSEINPH